MFSNKLISLEEARKQKKLSRFIKEHPSKGDQQQFKELLHNMTHNIKPKKPSKDEKTSKKE
jgi:hypothetical protein